MFAALKILTENTETTFSDEYTLTYKGNIRDFHVARLTGHLQEKHAL